MVNSLRPSSTRSPTRRTSVKHPTPPPSHLSSTPSHPHEEGYEPLRTPTESDRPAKRIKLTIKGPRSPAVPADVSNTDATIASPRPPVKLTFTEPHGALIQTTNGVRKTLNVTDDALASSASPASTPDPSIHPSALSQREPRKASERRSLRSQDEGPRIKSELAVYFPNYEDIVYDAPKEPEFLTTETIIHISDEPYVPPQEQRSKHAIGAGAGSTRNHRMSVSPVKLSPSKQKNLNGAQVIDFSSIEKSVGHHPKDPLTDSFYFKSHRRAERKEKQLRNIEKERAMHEKAQLERLLDALQGHDWLRVMGINSVSDADARKYESKRNYFVDEVNALLLKFKTWKDEERRIRLEKEAAAMAEEEEDEEENSDGEPSSSDVDASAARQLQIEASGGAKGGKDAKSKGKPRAPASVPAPAPPPPAPPPAIVRPPTPEGPFVSFYSKPHLRAAALGKSRHGRNLTAFGQVIPEPEEEEFALPGDYITPEALRDNARKRRRMKRESAVDAANK